jgi:MFS family permease
MNSLVPYLTVDVCLLTGLCLLMLTRLSFWHPATVYLVFHFYSFTWRAFGLVNGAAPMYAQNPNADVITAAEFERALVWADVGLVVFCAAAYWAHVRFEQLSGKPVVRRMIAPRIVTVVCCVALPAGVWALYAAKSGMVLSETVASSGYFQAMAMWPFGCAGMLVFAYGFRWYSLLLIGGYLAAVALQGYHRFMVLFPLIFFAAYFLQSRRRRWPTFAILLAGFLMAMVFPRLKHIGQAYQNGDTAEAISLLVGSFVESKSYEEVSVGEDFFDQFAGGLTMVDEAGKWYYGSTYLAIVTLPVPRSVWPDKPGLADHVTEISTSRRQYNVEGRILTYLGEAYLNFGYLGMVIIPGLIGYLLTKWCLLATSGPLRRFDRYLYVVFFIAFIQLYRDGLLSLLVFTVVHNIPMAVTWFLHYVPGLAPKVLDLPPADPRAQDDGAIAVLR